MSRRRQRLGQQERQAQLLALLRREGTVRIATLAKVFDVTTETARRDLDELAAAGALKRTYGGGASRSLIDEPGIGIRNRAHAAERGVIASAAARMVESGDALMIDCGSTTSVFANVLAARNLHLTVLTNCLPVAHALSTNAHCRVILCPGDYIAREVGTFGTDTHRVRREVQGDKAFIGAGGLGARRRHGRRLDGLLRQARDDAAGGPDDPAARQLEIRPDAFRADLRACRHRRRWSPKPRRRKARRG